MNDSIKGDISYPGGVCERVDAYTSHKHERDVSECHIHVELTPYAGCGTRTICGMRVGGSVPHARGTHICTLIGIMVA